MAARLAFAEVVFLDNYIRCYEEWDDVGSGEVAVKVSYWLTEALVSSDYEEKYIRSHVLDIVSRLELERKAML